MNETAGEVVSRPAIRISYETLVRSAATPEQFFSMTPAVQMILHAIGGQYLSVAEVAAQTKLNVADVCAAVTDMVVRNIIEVGATEEPVPPPETAGQTAPTKPVSHANTNLELLESVLNGISSL